MNWKIVFSAMALLFLIAACGGRGTSGVADQQAGEEGSTSATSTPTTSSDTAKEPSKPGERIDGGSLVRVGADPPTLDPHLTTDATSATIIVEVFSGLVTINPDLKIVGDIAETWDVSPDGMTYTFHLRDNAKFHDGKPVTAHDVKWSLERATDPLTAAPVVDQYLGDIVGAKERLKGTASELEGVKVINDQTLEITIDAPKSYFLAKMTYPTAFVLDQENVESGRRWFRTPNGTGPFRLSEYVPGETLVLTRNKDFHLGSPFLDDIRFILSGGTSMLMYENDEIHLTGVGLADLDLILDPSNPLNSDLNQAPPSFSTSYIGMNVNDPPFDDIKVRQALNYAIDKESIARDVYAGLVIPANGILPPQFPGYTKDIKGYEYDPDKALRLLRESKYGDSLDDLPPIILTTAGSFGSQLTLDMEVIREMWRQNLGIEVEVLQTEFATYLQDLVKRRFQMFDIGWIADYPDPENFLDLLFYGTSSNNHTGYNNAEVNRLLEEARVEQQEDVRYELYHKIEQIIIDEAPWIPLWYSGEQYVLVKPYVKDYFLTQLIIPKLRFVYMTEK